jgi:hypothetical protein
MLSKVDIKYQAYRTKHVPSYYFPCIHVPRIVDFLQYNIHTIELTHVKYFRIKAYTDLSFFIHSLFLLYTDLSFFIYFSHALMQPDFFSSSSYKKIELELYCTSNVL